MSGWLQDAGGFAGIAALVVAAATFYSHRTSARASARSGDLQEKAVELQEQAEKTTGADLLVKNAIALAEAVQNRLGQVEAELASVRADAAREKVELTGRIEDLERERDELLDLLQEMGAPRTIAQARRQRRRDADAG